MVRLLLVAAGLVFAVGAYLGAYHAGAEWGLWAGPTDCGATGAGSTNAADMLKEIQNVRIVSCSEASWRFLYLSFAGWNMVVCLFIVAVVLWNTVRARREGTGGPA